VLATISVLGGAVLVSGSAYASIAGGGDGVAFVPISHGVLNNALVLAHGSISPAVIGGGTTVPTDATTVRMTVSVKGSAPGNLTIYPAGNPSGGSGDTVAWASAFKTGTGQAIEHVGASNEVTFINNSSQPVSITVTITGYSTQVTAKDISGAGGTDGQVLTNTGAGTQWQTPGIVYTTSYDEPPNLLLDFHLTPVTFLELPAGSYSFQASGTARIGVQGGTANLQCWLENEATGNIFTLALASVAGSVPEASIMLQHVAVLDGPAIVEWDCSSSGQSYLGFYTLTATPVGTVHQQAGF
jgi:hypothetical protein